ncbi:MAG: hypothetical protein ACKVOI_20530 [Dongiaceae bacterium]
MNLEFYIVAVVFFTFVYCVFTLPRMLWRRRKRRQQRETMARAVSDLFQG